MKRYGLTLIATIVTLLTCGIGPALAHPHVWVSVESKVLFENGAVTGLRLRWIFDEFYTNMAIDGLDTNNDGIYSRTELAELAKVNIEGLGQLGYYTHAKLASQRLSFDAPKDYWLDHAAVQELPGPGKAMQSLSSDNTAAPDGKADSKSGFWAGLVGRLTGPAQERPPEIKVLALEFTLPLTQPVLAEAEGFEYGVYDPDFWIWFDFVASRGAALGPNAPAGCTATVGVPQKDAAQLQQLNEALFSQLGGSQPGAGVAKSVSLKCPKS